MSPDLHPSGRREPRGLDPQWDANAGEMPRLQSVDIDLGGLDEFDAVPQPRAQRPPQENWKPRSKRGSGLWFTVIAGGLSVGGLILYLLITLSQIGPPNLARQADERKSAAPADVRPEPSSQRRR